MDELSVREKDNITLVSESLTMVYYQKNVNMLCKTVITILQSNV